jgi:hypothetical protein
MLGQDSPEQSRRAHYDGLMMFRLLLYSLTFGVICSHSKHYERGKRSVRFVINDSIDHPTECSLGHSFNTSSPRVCQPTPVARKYSTTSGLYRTDSNIPIFMDYAFISFFYCKLRSRPEFATLAETFDQFYKT